MHLILLDKTYMIWKYQNTLKIKVFFYMYHSSIIYQNIWCALKVLHVFNSCKQYI